MDGDPMYKTDEALSTLTDFVTDVMIQLCEGADNEQAQSFSNDTGGELIDLLKEAREGLGKVDIRFLGNPSLDKKIGTFLAEATFLDGEFNNKKLKNSLKMIHHVKEMLCFYLSQSWNSELSQPEDHSRKVSPRNDDSQQDLDSSQEKEKRVLKKVTPKKIDTKWTCSHCSKIFTNAESYNKHQAEYKLDDRVEIPKVSCMLQKRGKNKRCTSKQPLSQMYRHLDDCHDIPRPSTNLHLRFFESVDGGKTFSDVVLLPLNARDPDPETFIDYDHMPTAKSVSKEKNKLSTKMNEKEKTNPDEVTSDPSKAQNNEKVSPANSVLDDSLRLAEISRRQSESGQKQSTKRHLDRGTIEDENDDMPPVKITRDEHSDSLNRSIMDDEGSVSSRENPEQSNSEDSEENTGLSESENDDGEDNRNEEQLKTPKQLIVKVSSTSPESIKEIPGLLYDSDEEDSDTAEFNRNRIENKQKRYTSRQNVDEEEEPKLEDLPGNAEVISKFTTFLKEQKYSTTANKNTSTIDKAKGHLFIHPHSFVAFMTDQDATFRLNRLLQFKNVDLLLEIKSPMDWQLSEAGDSGLENPSKRRSMLKAHASFRDFLTEELEAADLGTDLESLCRKEKLRSNIQNIEKALKKKKIWSELDRLEKEEKSERDNLKEGLNPNNNFNETVAVQKWFASKKFIELLDKNVSVWEEAINSNSISKTDFVAFANFAKFTLVLQDKNRAASYDFSNLQFACGQKLWFPQDGDSEDGWNPHQPQNRPHDAWQLKISGTKSGLKFGRTVTVTLEGYSQDLMEKFRDLKQIVFGDELDMDANFFCNFDGNPLSVMRNTQGSLWSIFQETCDIDKATVTMVRRALEHKAQGSQASVKRLNVINSHSEEVGLSHYDKSAPDYRSGFLHEVSQQEGSSKTVVDKDLPDKVISNREMREERDKEKKAQLTQEKLGKATKSRYTLGKNMKIFPDDRRFIQQILSAEDYLHLHSITDEDVFPAPKKFKSVFYRLVDSDDLKEEDRVRLREIEAKTFKVVREDVSKKFKDGWDDSQEVNKEADKVVASKVRNSLKIYEKNKSKHSPTFFLF